MSPLPADHRDALRVILGALRFPASVGQLIAQAQSWGATAELLEELNRLPPRVYEHSEVLLATLDAADAHLLQANPTPPRSRRLRRIHTIVPSSELL